MNSKNLPIRKPRTKRRRRISIPAKTLTNLNALLIRKIANSLPKNSNKYRIYKVLPPHLKNSIRPLIEEINNNIAQREQKLLNFEMMIPLNENFRNNINRESAKHFIRLSNNYHTRYPLLNKNIPNANVNTLSRIGRRGYRGSGYYKRIANRIRPKVILELPQPVREKTRITAHWTGPYSNVGNKRYKHWMSLNGKYKFYPYQTRQGRMNIWNNNSLKYIRHKHAKKKFTFYIPGYTY